MFSFLAEILAITFLGFGAIYPLLLWLSPHKLINSEFYRFNQGMVSIVISIGIIFIYLSSSLLNNFYFGVFWLFIQLFITAIYWKTENINNIFISIPSVIGISYLILIMSQIFTVDLSIINYIIIFNSYSIVALVFYSMILGHWYLNVINLPIKLLKRSILVFSLLIIIRTLWDFVFMSLENIVDPYGISYSLWAFTFEFEGFLLAIAIFMGNIVPLILNLFIWKTLKLQATQSATGLIYVSVISILFGELLFKYYLLKFGFLL